MLQKRNIFFCNAVPAQFFLTPGTAAAAEGHGIADFHFRASLPQQFQNFIIGTSLSLHGFQLTGIVQLFQILFRKRGNSYFCHIVFQIAILEHNVPADVTVRHFFTQLLYMRGIHFLASQIQNLQILGIQLSGNNMIVHQYPYRSTNRCSQQDENHCQGNNQSLFSLLLFGIIGIFSHFRSPPT